MSILKIKSGLLAAIGTLVDNVLYYATDTDDLYIGKSAVNTLLTRTKTHATTHQAGGSDPIKLDDLAAPDDNTDLNASTSAHGLLKKLSNVATEYMNGQGNWSTPSGGSGTVTSVDVSGGITGLTFSGGPVTTSGTITMTGTLAIANGGTGSTTLVKLDDWGTPDDNTDLNVSTTRHGLCPKLPNITGYFLDGQGNYNPPSIQAQDNQYGVVELATQSEMETGTTTAATVVTPGRMKYHAGVCKGWVTFDGTGTPAATASYNYTSVTDNGTGDWTITWDVDMSVHTYVALCSATAPGHGVSARFPCFDNTATGSTRIFYGEVDGSGIYQAVDRDEVMVAIFGDQ